jgi:hypothetical protein
VETRSRPNETRSLLSLFLAFHCLEEVLLMVLYLLLLSLLLCPARSKETLPLSLFLLISL